MLFSGQTIHVRVIKVVHVDDIHVQYSLLSVSMRHVANWGCVCRMFDEMRERDVVSWIVLITGYKCTKKYDEALITYEQMQYAACEAQSYDKLLVLVLVLLKWEFGFMIL
ncbi:hypothetical protein SLA2020_164770 [Shorea laevis]